jgi:hypothetical protein
MSLTILTDKKAAYNIGLPSCGLNWFCNLLYFIYLYLRGIIRGSLLPQNGKPQNVICHFRTTHRQMSKIITILTLGLQIAMTFIATFCIYMVFALLDSDFGIDGIFGLLFFHPIIGILISAMTIIVCLIIGLPIRLINKINDWWIKYNYISIMGTIIGITFLILSLLPQYKETVSICIGETSAVKQIPNEMFSYIGWILTSFSILHTYPPKQVTEKLNLFLKRIIR